MENKAEKVKPYNSPEGKKKEVELMFNNISGKYDFLNHLLSLGIDKKWRKNLIRMLASTHPQSILDMATGTGDLAIMTSKYIPAAKITGLDISSGMIDVGRLKIIEKNDLQEKINMIHGDSENMPFSASSFDAVTVAFGVRNYENLLTGTF